MFYVEKETLPRHWWACAGYVEERVGEFLGNDGEHHSYKAAHAMAKIDQSIKKHKQYTRLINKFSTAYLISCKVRSLWDMELRKRLTAYYFELREAKQSCNDPVEVKYVELPALIPVRGTRLSIGTKVYLVDSYNLSLKSGSVISESISYYDFRPEGVDAYYELDNKVAVMSSLNNVHTNQEFFLDEKLAVERLQGLIKKRKDELEHRLKTK